MSGAQLLEFGSEPRFGNLSFSDLEIRFEKYLDRAKNISDLDSLIRSVGPLFKNDIYNAEELLRLKKLRQRAYDQRRKPKFQIADASRSETPKIKKTESAGSENQESKKSEPKLKLATDLDIPKIAPQAGVIVQAKATDRIISQPKSETFAQGALRALTNINGEQFIKTGPKLLAWFTASLLISFFLWQQSITLYETANFNNALYTAAGGILMIVGFAAYHSISRSWLALFLCIYAGAYESYLMVSGTFNNENRVQAIEVKNSPELVFLEEQATKEHNRYLELKQRYDNPESKVFKNEWFLKNHVDPAWALSVKTHEAFMAKKDILMASTNTEHVTWLKIFYRLGLVFLCMVLVHRFFGCCITPTNNRLEKHA